MFSTLDTISLFELYEWLYDELTLFENRDVAIKIVKQLELEIKVEQGKFYLSHSDTSYSEIEFLGRVASQLVDSVFRLTLLEAGNHFLLVSSEGRVLRGSSLFLEYLDTPDESPLKQEFKAKTGLPWLFLEYPTYLISLEQWDRFSRNFLLENDLIDENFVLTTAERVRPFQGWSLCLERKRAPRNAQECLELASIHIDRATAKKLGRPRMEKAFTAFAAMGFEKGNLSWVQLQDRIEKQTGERPSPKTFRDWIAKQHSDENSTSPRD